jgi:hypothetical protein
MSETIGDSTHKKVMKPLSLMIVGAFLLAFTVPISLIAINGKNLSLTYSPTVINGILTATAILFGFAANEIRQFKDYSVKLLMLVPMLIALALAVQWYFSDTVSGENPTIATLYLSTAVFNLSMYMVVVATIYKSLTVANSSER